jgi:hypothetical protein
MRKLQKSALRKAFAWRGQRSGPALVAWLNEARSEEKKRILSLLADLEEERRPNIRLRRRKEIAQRVSSTLAWYERHISFTVEGLGEGGLKVQLVLGPDGEGEALNALIELLTIGMDWRVRRCLCGTWLYARYADSTECEECTRHRKKAQQKARRSTRKGRKANAQYQRDWRERNRGRKA